MFLNISNICLRRNITKTFVKPRQHATQNATFLTLVLKPQDMYRLFCKESPEKPDSEGKSRSQSHGLDMPRDDNKNDDDGDYDDILRRSVVMKPVFIRYNLRS